MNDIGYAPTVRDTGFHPLGGANYLIGHGYPPVLAELVVHHFGAWFVADVCGLSDELRRYRFQEDGVSDALTTRVRVSGGMAPRCRCRSGSRRSWTGTVRTRRTRGRAAAGNRICVRRRRGSNSASPAGRAVTCDRTFTAAPFVGHIDLAASITGRTREVPLALLWEMMMDIDGSFELDVERTGWDDIALVLPRHDLRINLDPVEAARICRDIWAALGREQPAANSHAA